MAVLNPDPEIEKALVRRYWQSAKGFWTGDQRRIAWTMTVMLLVLVVLQLAVSYGLNLWNRQLFDALEKKDGATVLYQSGLFVPLAAASRCRDLGCLGPHANPASVQSLVYGACG